MGMVMILIYIFIFMKNITVCCIPTTVATIQPCCNIAMQHVAFISIRIVSNPIACNIRARIASGGWSP